MTQTAVQNYLVSYIQKWFDKFQMKGKRDSDLVENLLHHTYTI